MTPIDTANAIIAQQADELAALQRDLEETRAAYTCLRQLVEAYSMVHDVDINWDDYPKETLAMAHQEINDLNARVKILCAALEDISTTAHCIAKAGPLYTPTLGDAWVRFMEISAKATDALSATRRLQGVTEKLGKTRKELDQGYAAFQRDLPKHETES